MDLYTIGVYGKTEDDFFEALISNNITLFVDVRLRRGVRGERYKFVNSKYLQGKLKENNIDYKHFKELAPTKEIRRLQKINDVQNNISKSKRQQLGAEFCNAYDEIIIQNYNFDNIISLIGGGNKLALFCVEEHHLACHRSLVTNKVCELLPSITVKNL